MVSILELCKVDVPEAQQGNWQVERFEVKENDSGRIYYMLHGRDVPAGVYTRLKRGNSTIMSDTPSEIRDHFEPIFQAKELGGKVLINGLGLGCILKAVLSFSNVTHVDVVELEQDVIDLVAPSYTFDQRVHIHRADAYDIQWAKGTVWNVAWHDVWDSICEDNLEGMAKLHRKYGRRVKWQGSWCKCECLRQRRSW